MSITTLLNPDRRDEHDAMAGMMPWLRDSEYARHHSYNKCSRQLRLRHGQLRERTSGLTNFQVQLQYTCGVARGTKMAGGELKAYNLYPLVTALW